MCDLRGSRSKVYSNLDAMSRLVLDLDPIEVTPTLILKITAFCANDYLLITKTM